MHAQIPPCVTYESGMVSIEDFPTDKGPVWILGKKYDMKRQRHEAKVDVVSRLWMTYRRGFANIGGTGPTSDQGWGCMLRCGQMMLAQALICRHLGRDWRWSRSKPEENYIRILKMFLDRKDSPYSIQQIAQMGVGEGKSIGMWFGPNTVAQVLRKLAAFDNWSNLAVHVALDNTVVQEDIRKVCLASPTDHVKAPCESSECSRVLPNGTVEDTNCGAGAVSKERWRPVLLFIPLRLGLNEINAVYIQRLKRCFTLTQSLGVIGGKPNHAHYFIGFVGDELVYLDPHTTQPSTSTDKWGFLQDEGYHCEHACRMSIHNLDPSIALGYYCQDEADFQAWCRDIQQVIKEQDMSPMFELTEERPSHWPPFDPGHSSMEPSFEIRELDEEPTYDSDEEFELV
ncbi:cysteine protease ATG4B-like isoform X2 [Asterias rubens]|uniref:cysteine protease ATG4B-like isoform X2 n=1 Tax=Asterias rubens TaxID=7604 RepID=UPI001454ECAB|nr:cysteine protease ATG4B-like isoform X2 [Asterias rubens]